MEEWSKQSGMQRALEASPEFQGLLRICPQRQLPVFTEYRGVKIKCLIDLAGHDARQRRCFGDLKCILDASPRGFGKLAYIRHLDMQIYMYRTALALSEKLEEPPLPFWSAVESSGVPVVSNFGVPSEALESGRRKLDKCIDLLKTYQDQKDWPGYGDGWMEPVWPRWANGAPSWLLRAAPQGSSNSNPKPNSTQTACPLRGWVNVWKALGNHADATKQLWHRVESALYPTSCDDEPREPDQDTDHDDELNSKLGEGIV